MVLRRQLAEQFREVEADRHGVDVLVQLEERRFRGRAGHGIGVLPLVENEVVVGEELGRREHVALHSGRPAHKGTDEPVLRGEDRDERVGLSDLLGLDDQTVSLDIHSASPP